MLSLSHFHLLLLLQLYFYLLSLRVLTDGTQLPFEVTITGDVVQQRFVLKDLNTSSSSSVVHLGATYYGSVATKRMVLYNDSPATTNYVANINMQCPGTEQVYVQCTYLCMYMTGNFYSDDYLYVIILFFSLSFLVSSLLGC